MRDASGLLQRLLPDLVALRHDIHRQPELGYEEHGTARRILAQIEGIDGLQLRTGVAGTGVVATLGADRPGPCVALRADMDALPIQEQADHEHKSQVSGKMHACGHDGHVTCLVGAVRVLAQQRDELAGPVHVVFQPAAGGAGLTVKGASVAVGAVGLAIGEAQMITDSNSEDRLVQESLRDHLSDALGWDSIYAYNAETCGPNGTLGRAAEREALLVRDLRAALLRLNPDLPASAREQAIEKLTRIDYARSLVQHNREFYSFIRTGVPVEWRDALGETRYARAQVIDFRNVANNRFLAVRELKIQGVRVPHYNRRADLVCFVNGLPVVFIELKAVYRNIRAGFDDNLTDYLHEHSIAHAFHHNAFLVVSNGDQARYGSITSKWEHFVEWKRNAEQDKGRVDAEALLDGMLAKERLLDLVENFILLDDSRAGGTRKIVARNHQVLGVNNAVASVLHQEELKRMFLPGERLVDHSVPMPQLRKAADGHLPIYARVGAA